jgi:thymidine kinase
MSGSIEVIAGGMFCGKTEELLRRVRRECLARRCVQLFKHSIDDRYSVDSVSTHDAIQLPCLSAKTAGEIRRQILPTTQVVAIDEVQFFDEEIIDLSSDLADNGYRVILAGLDMDFKRIPFGPMPALLSIADDVSKIRAVCITCGGPANYSYRMGGGDRTVQVGSTDTYEARCRGCFHVGNRICAVPPHSETINTV